MSYTAPLKDIEFVLNDVADLAGVTALPGCEEATPDLVSAVLEEAGKLASGVLAPLNRVGDEQGSHLKGDTVVTPDGWRDAYRLFVEGGWNGLPFDPQLGGQGLPWLVATAVNEIWNAANLSFTLCPMLTQSAIEAILLHGTDEQKTTYLPKLVSGEWTGTMNLTESQAGSDLSAVRTRAVPNGDHYLISGQKVFITYGDHDLTDNIIHMVLARTPDAPEGTKGISLFVVPKFKLDAHGNPAERNDIRTVSLERKLGIHASPTVVLSYGDEGGAVGYLVGEENRGLQYMFTMMNLARHAVGIEGLGIAERAFQHACDYARERVQGRPVGAAGAERVAIADHPDVRRMLLTMKSQIEAMRALAYLTAAAMDKAARHPDAAQRRRNQALVDLFTPVVKGWSTEVGNDIADLAVQVHGGMGYIEETGAAQYFRDARITTIYEGTTGIQAADLVGRKVLRDGGATARAVIDDMRALARELETREGTTPGMEEVERSSPPVRSTQTGMPEPTTFATIRLALNDGVDALALATTWILDAASRDPRLPAAAAGPYLHLWGTVAGGWLMARSALAADQRMRAGDEDTEFYRKRIATAKFYATQILPRSAGLAAAITGADAVLDTDLV